MTVKFTNNANSTLASGINSSATSMTLADASSFPSLAGANDYCYLTLQESGGTTREIVKATALSSNTFTIVRGQDNTSAATWSSGILVELRITSALLQDVIDGLGSGSMMDTDIFTGDGSDTTFTLSRQPDDENHLLVFIDGVFQSHSAYSVSGTTLTMSAAPANGRVLTVYHMATTVGGSNLVKATMTGDNSDTTLDVGSQILHENNVQVFFNGVYQSKSNYSVSGSVITFSTAPPTGVAVEAVLNTATNISTAAQVSDADNDTLIQVEESADEDKIRFDTAGTERMVLDSTSLTVTPKIVSDAGIDIDNINIDGTTIALSSGDLTIDVAGDIILDADGGDFNFKDGGTTLLSLSNAGSNNVQFLTGISDGDLLFKGVDGGSVITALTLDMSDAGTAIFNNKVGIGVAAPDNLLHIKTTGSTPAIELEQDAGTSYKGLIKLAGNDLEIRGSSGVMEFYTGNNDGDSSTLRMSISAAGTATFEHPVVVQSGATQGYYIENNAGNATTPRITNDANDWTIIRPGASGADVSVNNYANTANIFTVTDEGDVGINEGTPTSYYSKTFQINGSGNTSAIKLTNTSTGNENGRGMDIAADVTNLRIINREVGGIELYTGPVGSPALGLSVDTNGHVRMPKQPCAGVLSADQSLPANLTTLVFDTERFDLNGDFDNSTYKFNAPTTGKYLVTVNLYLKVIDNAAGYYQLYIVSDNRTYYSIFDPNLSADADYWDMTWSAIIDMDENDKVYFRMNQSGGTAQTVMDSQSYASFVLVA